MNESARYTSKYSLMVGALLILFNFSAGLSFASIAPILPRVMESYELSHFLGGVTVGVLLGVSGVAAFPAGYLLARFRIKWLLGLAWVLCSFSIFTSLIDTYEFLLFQRIFFGIGIAFIVPASGPLIMQWFNPKHIALVTGVFFASVSFGIAAGIFVTDRLAEVFSWQTVMSAEGLLLLIGGILWILFGKERVNQEQSNNSLGLKDIWVILRSRITILMIIADAGPFACYIAFSAWLPTYYHELFDMSLTEAGTIIGFAPLIGGFCLIFGGWLHHRRFSRKQMFIITGLAIPLFGFGSFTFESVLLLYLCVLGLGAFSWLYIPFLMTIPTEQENATQAHVAITWALLTGVGAVIAFVAPLSVGLSHDIFGTFKPGLGFWAICACSIAIVAFILPKAPFAEE